jgi:hypothetical protein
MIIFGGEWDCLVQKDRWGLLAAREIGWLAKELSASLQDSWIASDRAI